MEVVERKSKPSELVKPRKHNGSKVERSIDSSGIGVSGAQEASGRVGGTCVEKWLCLDSCGFERQSQLRSNVCQLEDLIDDPRMTRR